jgi:EAL domain-containing protein (putative c-di-GMP-specific phosphodiesterase class I)
VETEAQKQLLESLQCDEIQGFLYAKALPAIEFEAAYILNPAQLIA